MARPVCPDQYHSLTHHAPDQRPEQRVGAENRNTSRNSPEDGL